MSAESFDAVLYRVLAYCYACMEAGADPDLQRMREVSGVNPVFFDRVMRSAIHDGYVSGFSYAAFIYSAKDVLTAEPGCGITREGASFLANDESMAKVRKALGDVFQNVLAGLVQATVQKAMGL